MSQDKKVLLFSGGLDSYVLSRLYDYDTLLFVHLGTEDCAQEYERLKHTPIWEKVTEDDLDLSAHELPSKIIPFRNHMLAMLASNYGNVITFGFTLGDTTKDKDYVFKSQVEQCLNYFALDGHKMPHQNYPFRIDMPFKDMTKADLVKLYLEKNLPQEDLILSSRSCYSGEHIECGKCRSCRRKYIALRAAGFLRSSFNFEHQIDLVDLRYELDEAVKKGRHSREIGDIQSVISSDSILHW